MKDAEDKKEEGKTDFNTAILVAIWPTKHYLKQQLEENEKAGTEVIQIRNQKSDESPNELDILNKRIEELQRFYR